MTEMKVSDISAPQWNMTTLYCQQFHQKKWDLISHIRLRQNLNPTK